MYFPGYRRVYNTTYDIPPITVQNSSTRYCRKRVYRQIFPGFRQSLRAQGLAWTIFHHSQINVTTLRVCNITCERPPNNAQYSSAPVREPEDTFSQYSTEQYVLKHSRGA